MEKPIYFLTSLGTVSLITNRYLGIHRWKYHMFSSPFSFGGRFLFFNTSPSPNCNQTTASNDTSSLFSCGQGGFCSSVTFSKSNLQMWPGSASFSRPSLILVWSILFSLHNWGPAWQKCFQRFLYRRVEQGLVWGRIACSLVQLSLSLPNSFHVINYYFFLNHYLLSKPRTFRSTHWKSSDFFLKVLHLD